MMCHVLSTCHVKCFCSVFVHVQRNEGGLDFATRHCSIVRGFLAVTSAPGLSGR